jgi:phage recombination protein Bet
LTPAEFALFCHVARARHLDPLQRQIHAVKRSTWDAEKNGYVDKMTIQTAIDGYRAIANRTGLYMPSDHLPMVEDLGKENLRVTVWVKKYSANDGVWHSFGATAYYREYVQTRKNKATNKLEPNSMWEKMPIAQLTKCAEALALRRGWPEELGGIYTDDELPSQEPVVLPPQPTSQNKTERAMGTLRTSKEPNRGHGNEGMVATQRPPEKEICAECRMVNGHTPDCKLNGSLSTNQTTGDAAAQKGGTKKGKREAWDTQPGHDMKIHIGFDDAIQLFDIQRHLKLSDDEVKNLLDREFEIQHRYLIRKDQFDQVLQAIEAEFGAKAKNDDSDVEDDGVFLAE